MKKQIFTCLILLFSCNAFAQTQNVDSLVNVLETQKLTADDQLDLYDRICGIYVSSDIDKAIVYSKTGMVLAEKSKNRKKLLEFTHHTGIAYFNKANYDSAFIYLDKALTMSIAAKDSNKELEIYASMGALFGAQNKFSIALEYFTKGMQLSEAIGNKRVYIRILNNMGVLHRILNQSDRAVYYLEKLLTIADELNDIRGKYKAYLELGNIYYQEDWDIDKALDYIFQVVELSRTTNDKRYEVAGLSSLALIYAGIFGEFEKAEKYALEGLYIAEKLGDPGILMACRLALSSVYRGQGRYKECEIQALKVWEMDSTNLDSGREVTSNLVYANILSGNKNKAVYFLEKNNSIVKKITDRNLHNAIADMEIKYETEKKEIRIAALEEEKKLYRWLGITGVAILLLVFGLLFFRHRVNIQKRKLSEQKVKQMEQEKQLIATQAVLDGETAERSRLARDLHDGLGGMLSVVKLNLKDVNHYAIMDGSDIDRYAKALDMLDQSIGELRRVAHHIMPESLMRYGLKVSLEDFCRAIPGAHFQYLGENPRLDSRLEVLIYRCAYELVNNAVKHAKANAIKVQLMVDSGVVSLTVHDNGVGFDPQTVKSGMGLDNIRTRIAMYNGKMTIHTSPEKGTEISIEIEQ